MFVLDEETKQSFRSDREESERMGITPEEMELVKEHAIGVLVRVGDHIEKLVPVCEKYPFIDAILTNVVNAAKNQLSYAYRLIENSQLPEDEPIQFKKDREIIFNLLQQNFSAQKG